MPVGKVSFGQSQVQAQKSEKKSSGIISGTVAAGATGAIVGGGLEYIVEKSIIKNPDKHVELIRKIGLENIKDVRKTLGNTNKVKEAIINIGKDTFARIKSTREFAKAGKIDWGSVGKSAGKIGLYTAGIYFAYQGIKAAVKAALFSSDKAA